MNKKASLGLSIQAIVIVVIGITILSLAIPFIQNLFDDIGGTTKEVQARAKESIVNAMRQTGKKMSITRDLQLERGKEKVEGIGLINQEVSSKRFGVKIIPLDKQLPDGTKGDISNIANEVDFFYNGAVDQELSPTEGVVISMSVSARKNAAGNYLFKANAYTESIEQLGVCDGAIDDITGAVAPSSGCELYATQSFFVKVS
jgi:hypothetical protein